MILFMTEIAKRSPAIHKFVAIMGKGGQILGFSAIDRSYLLLNSLIPRGKGPEA